MWVYVDAIHSTNLGLHYFEGASTGQRMPTPLLLTSAVRFGV